MAAAAVSGGSPGARFRLAVERSRPLPLLGAVSAYMALLAEHAGAEALYLSGGGVAAFSCGVPDLGITTAEDVATDLRRITAVTHVPILVDIDTGWGSSFNIARTIQTMEAAGAAAAHLEDQVQAKRCGHRPGKAIVPASEMVDRIKSAVDARRDADFVIMARTDALANEGLGAALDRAALYAEAGADMLFPEAVRELAQFRAFADAIDLPLLANITEFGMTPLFTRDELRGAGVHMVLYPLSAFRAMSKAALEVYSAILRDGTQQAVLPAMQTREELYAHLDYHSYERRLDRLFGLATGSASEAPTR